MIVFTLFGFLVFSSFCALFARKCWKQQQRIKLLELDRQEYLMSALLQNSAQELANHCSEWIGLFTSTGIMRYCNTPLQDNLGLVGHTVEPVNLAKLIQHDDNDLQWFHLVERATLQGFATGEMELITLDKSRLIPVSFTAFPIQTQQGKETLIGIVMSDITVQQQRRDERNRHDESMRRLVSLRTAELAAVNNTMRADLAQRKRLEERLVEAQKMEAMGQLSAGIAHEINNPIGFVNVNLDMLSRHIKVLMDLLNRYQSLEEHPSADCALAIQQIQSYKESIHYERILSDLEPMIEDSRKGISRVIEIVKSLKSFTRPQNMDGQEVNLENLLEDSLRMAWNQVKGFEIRKQFDPCPSIPGWPTQLAQVFLNLIVNAAQALQGVTSGVITLKIQNKGSHAIVVISDNGCGIAKENFSRLFDPFFTTKPIGEGTGLGLYISYGIIQKHHGDLIFSSEQGKGTSFQIVLPIKSFDPAFSQQ